MSKVTSKLQVTVPKSIAERLGIRPGDQIDWEIAGEVARVVPVKKKRRGEKNLREQLHLFDQASQRQRQREASIDPALLRRTAGERGWTREDLYTRGRSG
jgi:AbrB family looped-hinge helix DNA binding protein